MYNEIHLVLPEYILFMISLQRFRISSIISCLIQKGYDEVTAHSVSFLIALSEGDKDLSDFEPTEDGVKYTQFIETQCFNGFKLDLPSDVVKSLAKKLWIKITEGSRGEVTFTEEELNLMKKLGINI
jgi:hypothetical protein